MNLFLHTHEKGYTLNACEIPLALVSGIPYAARHIDLAKKNGKLGHLAIAVIELMPIIGAVAALIEKIFAACISLPKPIADVPLSKRRCSLPEPMIMPFKNDSDKPKKLIKRVSLPEPMTYSPPESINDRLIGKLIANGKYIQEPGDSFLDIDCVGHNQGTKETRRIYLEILRSGVDLFSDLNIKRIKLENNTLYETILIKAYGHIKSKKGRRGHTNLEGSCEALSMLMLFHSVKKLRSEIQGILTHTNAYSTIDEIIEYVEWRNRFIFFNLLNLNFDFIHKSHDPRAAALSLISDYEKKLGIIEESLKNASTAESSDDEIKNAFDRIVRGDPQIVCSGFDWHSEVIVYSRNEMIYHNRGALKENGKEIHVNSMQNGSVTLDLLKTLANRFLRVKTDSSLSLALATSIAPFQRTIEKKLKDAKGGFCTHTQPKAAIYTLFSLNEGAARYQTSTYWYKLFTLMHREYFSEIFQRHSISGLF
ncbi:MAG: hypothetical protein ACK4HV_00860 [Parachlamydiaceae bacterium]